MPKGLFYLGLLIKGSIFTTQKTNYPYKKQEKLHSVSWKVIAKAIYSEIW